MLLYFKTRNNLSYQEETEFSMIAGSYSDHPENLVDVPRYGIKVLKSSVIYGANASGKSNLLKAMVDGVLFIQNSFANSHIENGLPFIPNKNQDKKFENYTLYLYGILVNDTYFEYYFSVNKERILEEYLVEYLTQKPTQHFHRKYNSGTEKYEWKFNKVFKGEKDAVKNITNDKTLFLTISSQAELPISMKVYNWFAEQVKWSIDLQAPGNIYPDYTLRLMKNLPDFKQEVLRELKDVDFMIDDVIIEDLQPELKENSILKTTVIHKAIDIKGNEIRVSYDLNTEESAGTRRFLAWIGIWIQFLFSGKVLLIDELGTSMHTLLSKHLINMFHKDNKSGSQLIFTTHDTNLMTQEIFRRDQIWIVDRDKTGNSQLYPLSDFKIKKDKVLENAYLQGVYGGIPIIQED